MRSRDADPSHRTPKPRYRGFDRTSRHLTMRDGTRIAIDVCLPRDAGAARLPTIVRSTRYFRRFQLASPLRGRVPETAIDPLNAPLRALFTSQGYAWVDVDARGSGASFGYRPSPWWLDGEVRDGGEVVEWIVRQPWSDGAVGSTGISYDGTTAEFLAYARHPAVKAVAPRFSLFDAYADIAFPGGVHLAWFTENWAAANAALDRNAPEAFVGTVLGLRATGAGDARVALPGTLPHALLQAFRAAPTQRALRAFLGAALGGVARVDGDRDGEVLAAAVASHARNVSVHEGAMGVTFRDDVPPASPPEGGTIDDFSPHHYLGELRASGVAFLSQSGWFDGAYANAAIKRQRALGGAANELVIGPWVHGGLLDLDPDAPATEAAFDHGAELLRFFDRHLRARHAGREPACEPARRVRYFLMGEGAWKHAAEFPPADVRTRALFLGPNRRLQHAAAKADARDVLAVDPRAGTGRRTRWETLLSPFVHADGPRIAPTAIAYESDPLDEDLEVTGSPVLVLRLATEPADATIFAYLSDVTRDGRVRTPTEGTLRTVHRTQLVEGDWPRVEASFAARDALGLGAGEYATHAIELQPTAFLFRRGHRLRLSIAGADVDHFRAPSGAPRTFRLDLAGSRLLLPVKPR
jgi:hypothetical protein